MPRLFCSSGRDSGAARRWTLFRLSSVRLVASAGHAIAVGPIMPRTRVGAGHRARLFAAVGGVAVHLFSHPLGSLIVIRDRRWRAACWDNEGQHQNRAEGARGPDALRPDPELGYDSPLRCHLAVSTLCPKPAALAAWGLFQSSFRGRCNAVAHGSTRDIGGDLESAGGQEFLRRMVRKNSSV